MSYNHQPVGQAYDVRAACAEAPLHAVVVGAVRPGDGDFSVLHGNGVMAVHGELLVDGQIHGFDRLALGCDPGEAGLLPGEEGKAQNDTDSGNGREEDDPGFCFHHAVLLRKECRGRPWPFPAVSVR